jgi:hypothetical protein
VWLDPGSTLRLARKSDGAADLALVRGHMRAFDPRGVDQPPPELRAAARDTQAVCSAIGDASDRFDPNDVASGAEGFVPPPPGGSSPDLQPCTLDGQCTGTENPVAPPPPSVIPAVPPRPVVESAPVFRPPPGLAVRPRS